MKPKILIWDIETSLMGVTVFQLKNDYIHPQNIVKDWHIISASWKWLGDKKVSNMLNKKGDNDKKLVAAMAKVLADADVVVHHNGDRFDIKKLNTRLIYHNIKPSYKKVMTVDTLKEAKKHFAFSSNSLAYLAFFLGVTHKKPSNHDYWMKEFKGDLSFAKAMLKYNDGDVRSLEEVYLKMRPYIDHPNIQNGVKSACPNCASKHTAKYGTRMTRTGIRKQRNQCQGCGSWFDTKIEVVK